MTRNYSELRDRIANKNRGWREKVMPLSEAVAMVRDGDQVAVGGCHYSRTPMAALWEIIRQKKTGLVISRSITSTEGDLLLAAGVSKHFVTSWFSAGVTWGISRIMRHYMQQKLAVYEEWSHMTLGLRFRAGAMGIPFLPSRALLGSDLLTQLPDLKTMKCPYTGDELSLLPALNPDVALIHAQRCDPYGNVQLDGFPFMDLDIAMAADKVIVTTERIIDNDQIRSAPDRTAVPFFCVDAVVEVPYGSLPHECYGLYEPDFGHIDGYVQQTGQGGVDGAKAYLNSHVFAPEGWNDFLELLGLKNVLHATMQAHEGN